MKFKDKHDLKLLEMVKHYVKSNIDSLTRDEIENLLEMHHLPMTVTVGEKEIQDIIDEIYVEKRLEEMLGEWKRT